MQRMTVTLDDEIADGLDAFVRARGYTNRSEAMRDPLRGSLRDISAAGRLEQLCIAVVSDIYDHHARDPGQRLMRAQHDHHALGVATLHTHLDHDHCLEVVLLRGPTSAMRGFGEAPVAERGERLGGVNLLPPRGMTAARAPSQRRRKHRR
jgi:CopG family nickel-responsive transcriptional regulator